MSDEKSAFETTRSRLEDIVSQVRRRDVTLEQSLDLLDEAVRLVNECNDLIDQTAFRASAGDETVPAGPDGVAAPAAVDAGSPSAESEAAGGPEETPDDARE